MADSAAGAPLFYGIPRKGHEGGTHGMRADLLVGWQQPQKIVEFPQTMSIMHFGGGLAPLLAALSIQFEINWPRFILAMVVLAALIGIVAQQMNESLSPKKKDSPFSSDYTDRGAANDAEPKRYL